MAKKQYLHDIDLVNVGQLVGARKQNVTTAERMALEATLTPQSTGLFVYDTTEKQGYTFNGVAFVIDTPKIVGDVIFKGFISSTEQGITVPEDVPGYEYVIDFDGVWNLDPLGPFFVLNAEMNPANPGKSVAVERGDRVLVGYDHILYVYQRNDKKAADNLYGNVKLATSDPASPAFVEYQFAPPGNGEVYAVTREVLVDLLDAIGRRTSGQYNNISLVADEPFVVEHGLQLTNANAFTYRVSDKLGNDVSVEIDAVTTIDPVSGITPIYSVVLRSSINVVVDLTLVGSHRGSVVDFTGV